MSKVVTKNQTYYTEDKIVFSGGYAHFMDEHCEMVLVRLENLLSIKSIKK